MNKLIYSFLFFIFISSIATAQNNSVTPSPTALKTVGLSMVAATSVKDHLPFEVYTPDSINWEPESDAEYVKLHSYFDEPIELGHIEIKSCEGKSLNGLVTFFVNFNELSDQLGRYTYLYNFQTPVAARSLTFNFNDNTNLCVSEIKLFDAHNNQYHFQVPRITSGTVTASSTLEPVGSYDVINLFDSRFENAWASNGKGKGEFLNFEFAGTERIEKIKIWNGYQRSDVHCYSNSRPKTLKLEGDNGYLLNVMVKDIMGSQVVNLDKPFVGTHLKMTVVDAYPGKTYSDLVISELRFFDGKEWFQLDPTPLLKRLSLDNRAAFQKAGLDMLLNKSWKGGHAQVTDPKKQKYGDWTFRFRSDGGLYVEGYNEGESTDQNFDALGNYEVKEASPNHLKLRIFGFLRKQISEIEGDCNGCGRDCNRPDNASGDTKKLFQDIITVSKQNNKVVIENNEKIKNLKFEKLELDIE